MRPVADRHIFAILYSRLAAVLMALFIAIGAIMIIAPPGRNPTPTDAAMS